MLEYTKTASDQSALKATLELILKNTVEALKGSSGVIATWSEVEHRFVLTVAYGLLPSAIVQLEPLLKEAAPDLASSRVSYGLLSDLYPGIDLPISNKGETQNPIIALPLLIGGRSIGLMYVLRTVNAGSFCGMDQSLMKAFAEQAAIAVQNARLAHLLAEEKYRIELILENSADGIITIDADRKITGMNRAMEQLTGYSRDELLGKECFKVLMLRDWEGKNICPLLCPMIEKSDTFKRSFEFQGIIRTKDGKDTYVSISYSIIRNPEGKPVNAIGNVRDVSRLKELENLRETFLSMLGHQLQTPISIIKGYTSTLIHSGDKLDKDTIQKGLQVIEEESDRLSRVMNKLLLASRLSTGTSVIKREIIDIKMICWKVIRRLKTLTYKHTFEVNISPDFPSVKADPDLIEEVLSNLLENAVKYSPDGGKITVSGESDSQYMRISISDEGIGIAEEDIPHLFERFYRIEKGVAKNIKGLGLGLYLSKIIVEAHGGKIDVFSKPGQGSKFTVFLPLNGK